MKNTYTYIEELPYDKKSKVQGTTCLSYYSKQAMKEKYPKGGYIVVGGIGKGLKSEVGVLVANQEEYPCFRVSYNKVLYGVDGYLLVDENQYVAVVKSRLVKHSVLALLSVLLIGLVMWGVWTLLEGDGLDKNAKDYTPPNGVNIETDPNHIAIPAYDDMKMEANTNRLYVALWNPPMNPCNFKFSIVLKESGDILYSSDLVAPGKAITEIRLQRKIKKGTHKVTVRIETYGLHDEKVKYNGGNIDTTITAIEPQ